MPDSESSSALASDEGKTSVGKILRRTRQERGLSLEQLAESLHLDEQILAALEQDDFGRLGAPVFVRGHLRTCARQLELDPDTLLRAYDSQYVEPNESLSVKASPRLAPATISLLPWVTGLIGVGLGIGLLIYLLQGEDAESLTAAKLSPGFVEEPAGEVFPAADSAAELTPTDGSPVSSEKFQAQAPPVSRSAEIDTRAGATAEPTTASAQPAADVVDSAPVVLNTEQRLRLDFRGEAWVEISDRRKRLLFGLQRAGVRRELVGEPPFKLVLGNSQMVDLYLNDEPYDLPAGSTRGKVSRFSIEPR